MNLKIFKKIKFMKKNILITWNSKWIWKYLTENLNKNYNIFWVSRTFKSSALDQEEQTSPLAPLLRGEGDWNKNYKLLTTNYLDLTDFSSYSDFFEKIKKENLKFDVIIFNAWVWYFWDFKDISSEKYTEIINLNLLSPIIFLQKIFPFLEKKVKIIFMWSVAGKKAFKNGSVYQASKFGLRWLALALKNEFPGKIHIINPKLVKTDFHKNSYVEIDYKNERITSLWDILKVVEDIILGKEERFEIDL